MPDLLNIQDNVVEPLRVDFNAIATVVPRKVRIRILFVTDGGISYANGADFGISKVLDTLRNLPIPNYFYVSFELTTADREGATPMINPNPGPYETRFTGFRFDMPDFNINDYDQIWFFGLKPGNGSDNVFDGTHLSDVELRILSQWMDSRQGGVFAAGDHEDLGATIAARIPRVRTMRRWVNEQGVPPIDGPTRHDTNVPATPAQVSGVAVMPNSNQSDGVAMKIKPRMYELGQWSPFLIRSEPHPILCGLNGVIDILPDHPHEGAVYEDSEVNLDGMINFDGYTAPEYPSGSGGQPRPEAIAHANVLGQPPLLYEKGPVATKSFPCIGVYDGQQTNVGRVVVDSTWHHWMNLNLVGLETSAPSDFARIQNYYRNVALWLATASQRSRMLLHIVWSSIFVYPGIEEYSVRHKIWVLGRLARNVLGRIAPQCTLTEWLLDFIVPKFRRELLKPRPDPCLTCPPFELFETFLLGGLLKELLPLASKVRTAGGQLDEKALATAAAQGAQRGHQELLSLYKDSLEQGRERLQLLSDALQKDLERSLLAEERGPNQ
jgi:hypothetical protein